jgi:hypothetical protein
MGHFLYGRFLYTYFFIGFGWYTENTRDKNTHLPNLNLYA